MTGNRCVHGLDRRFCAVCNKVSAFGRPRRAIASVTLAEILEFLNAEQVGATRRAIADVLGVESRTLDRLIVADTAEDRCGQIISSGMELAMRMSAWKSRQREANHR